MIRLILVLALLATPLWAVEPDEVLDDPALEARARELSKELRCPVCRNETIDESKADLAKDLRILVRDRLLAGDSDAQVLDYMVARYGDYVLLRPRFNWSNAALWFAGPLLLLAGGAIALTFIRRRPRAAAAPEPLSEAERARLDDLLGKDRGSTED